MFINPLDILKRGWLNLKIHSLKIVINKQLNLVWLDGTNEIEC